MSPVGCAPSKLLADIHYRLPHLSHVRFGGNFTDGSLSEILPGEIVHAGGWAGILWTVSFLLMMCFHVLCCCVCIRCKKGKCSITSSSARKLLRYTSGVLAILSVLAVLLAFWPETRMHDGINSSADDVLDLVSEIAESVIDSALLKTERQWHRWVIGYLVSLLLFMIVAIFIIFFAQPCKCGTGVLIVMIVLAVATTTIHIPLVVFLFAMLVVYADVCISIFSAEDGRLCMGVHQNISISSPSTNPDSLDVLCNQTVNYGFILLMVVVSLAAILVLIQLFGCCYGTLLCCTNKHKEKNYHSDEKERGISLRKIPATNTIDISNIIPWTPRQDYFGLEQVIRFSKEWLDIEKRIHATLTRARIIELHRIHNMWLWNPYTESKHRLSMKNKSITNEMLLFHGSSKTSPETIYKSEKGFDFRFAGHGLWGEGAYFAVNAQYSDGYAHVLPDGRRQFFLAMVLTGDSCPCNQDRSLRKPPLKDSNHVGSNMFADERYDSVQGYGNGSNIYVVYEHDKAYPAYLITYELLS